MTAHTTLKPLAGLFIALLVVGFSPLVDAESGWRETLGGIVWWSIFVLGGVLLVLGTVAYVTRARAARSEGARLS
jgi:predicted membrane channel-forming protein YqfA (hemolysin III family)